MNNGWGSKLAKITTKAIYHNLPMIVALGS